MTDETLTGDTTVRDEAQSRLERDHRSENALLWKGALALLGTLALAVARQRWWV